MAEDLGVLLAGKPATERVALYTGAGHIQARNICYQCYDLQTHGGVFGRGGE